METLNQKPQRCCFTGHRPEKLEGDPAFVKSLLKAAIEYAIKQGLTTFISGMARGVDMWAAQIVLEKREENKDIKLICASPFEGFEKRWSKEDIDTYRDIISKADYVKYVSLKYSPSCFQVRNCYMVDRSVMVIAAYNGEAGGTYNTVKYAKRKGVEVVNIFDEDFETYIKCEE